MSDLERGVGALKRFQTRVNALLADFEGGAGSSAKVGEQRVARASFSGLNAKFDEADSLFGQYNRVHEELVSLSKTLGAQIEGLSIAVHAAEVGFDKVEEDVRRRYAAIQTRIKAEQDVQWERKRSAEPKQSGNDDAPATKGLAN
ncbi:hypothetical protein J7E91_01145 [Streptomyces sp. ISL-99]|uniref:hypothetical protein n=1 Tax=Streptomyces sp. ISL-99 TaxID=2819193 RepID=UPI001BEBFBE8|nr:hypothetical protein [Streptomyces sp. ISL-99]MBT2524069.1 hypothetical protein [Streptomyces sp. ISL-99]